jgi:ABC-type multidrug transport system ATPase subunit
MRKAIEIDSLDFYYGNQHILKNIQLDVPIGSIYGFIGHNGAGKTTTIKILLNLLNADKGKVKIFGSDLAEHRNDCLAKIGALVEYPGIYAHLSAFENLKAKAIIFNISDDRIIEVLKLVKLFDVKDKKAGKFSQGMKQRLGIGLALLSNPELLILDEPTNGLDPSGIVEIRNLLIDLSELGKTIFISSHLLSEIEKFATHIAMIDHGEIKFKGKIADIHNTQKTQVLIHCDDYARACFLLQERNIEFNLTSDGLVVTTTNELFISEINKILVFGGVDVETLKPMRNSLEDIFFELTNTIA